MSIITHPTYAEVTQFCAEIVDQFAEANITTIVPIVRGGLIPGTIIAHMLGIPVRTMDIFNDKSVGDNVDSHISHAPVLKGDETILLVDEIIDSGSVFLSAIEVLHEVYPNIKVHAAVLYYKEYAHNCTNIVRHDKLEGFYCVNMIPVDAPFIYFPWEQGN